MTTNQSLNNCHNFSNTSILIYLYVAQAESSDFLFCFLLIILTEIFSTCSWLGGEETSTSSYVELKPVKREVFCLFFFFKELINKESNIKSQSETYDSII